MDEPFTVIPLRTFLSTLSLRRATFFIGHDFSHLNHFYPRSPCGERPNEAAKDKGKVEFLSTLSLRRATCHHHV